MEQRSAGHRPIRVLLVAGLAICLTACQDDDSPGGLDASSAAQPLFNGSSVVGDTNSSPVIAGNPGYKAVVGQMYSFAPIANDADGDNLAFSVRQLPRWATFNPKNGLIRGVPSMADSGSTGSIVISVSDGKAGNDLPAFRILITDEPSAFDVGSAPVLGGSPSGSANINEFYSFQPTATDFDGSLLQFGVVNLPGWLSFDASTGSLSGVPGSDDSGAYTDILLSVTDGTYTDTIGPFNIVVGGSGDDLVTLSWTIPAENADGSLLDNLVGYEIRYGRESGEYTDSVDLRDPWNTSYTIEGLSSGIYYFVSAAYNQYGIRSEFSNEVRVVVN